MEKTPLELYDTAYRLHYDENRVKDAVSYYEKLIREFPESNECGYAAIQLQKIKSSELVKELKGSKKVSSSAVVISLIFSLLSISAAGAGGFFLYSKMVIEQKRATLAVSALGKIYRGEDNEALKVLTELKILSKNDITPFELSADIYRKRMQFNQAKSEYELFYRLNPGRQPTTAELNIIEKDEQSTLRAITRSAQRTPPPAQPAEVAQPVETTQQAEVTQPVETKTEVKNISVPVKPVKTTQQRNNMVDRPVKHKHKGVDPDSVSYF